MDDVRLDELRARLRAPFVGRRAICALAPLAAFTEWVELLRDAGAQRPLLLASGLGSGPLPEEADVIMVDLPPMALMSEDVRRIDGVLRTGLPSAVLEAIDRYDPGRTALWLVGPFVDTAPLHGREVAGGRPRSWVALEDKTVVDQLWDAVGAPRAPSAVVGSTLEELTGAAARLDAGHGTVWAGDASQGLNGGGEYVRWVVTAEDAAAAAAFFAGRCERVRVMPFLEGVPCSIHGCVLPDGTASFRPVELAILRTPDRRLVYGGRGTTWDPRPDDRESMRDLARRAGEHLRRIVGYRGFFGIDGVLTADGFLPTELNPRMSGGVSDLARAVDPQLFLLLQLALVQGRDPGVGFRELEDWAVRLMDGHPFCKPIATTPAMLVEEPTDIPVVADGATLRQADSGADSAADTWLVRVGTNPSGTYARLEARTSDGARVGDLNAALMRFLDEHLGAGFGEVHPAPDVRGTGVGPSATTAGSGQPPTPRR